MQRIKAFSFFRSVLVEAIAPFYTHSLESYVSELDAEVASLGKLTKLEAGYVPFPVFPPIYWDYRCEECRQYASGTCKWVQGAIARDGFCVLWVPPKVFEKPFTWAKRVDKAPGIVLRSVTNLVTTQFWKER